MEDYVPRVRVKVQTVHLEVSCLQIMLKCSRNIFHGSVLKELEIDLQEFSELPVFSVCDHLKLHLEEICTFGSPKLHVIVGVFLHVQCFSHSSSLVFYSQAFQDCL